MWREESSIDLGAEAGMWFVAEVTNEESRALARVVLDGLSVGDAFGEAFAYSHHDMRRRVAAGVPAGPWWWTDDTAMALGIEECLLRAGSIDETVLAWIFARNFKREPDRGYGKMARRVLQQIGAGVPWEEASRGAFDGGSMGNGAAMRVGPLGAWFADDLDRVVSEAVKSARVTHWHPEGVAGAVAVAVAVACAWQSRGTEAELARELIGREVMARTPAGGTREMIGAALRMEPETELGRVARELGNGSLVTAPDTVPLVVWSALRSLDDFAGAIVTTVEAGGDCDTNAAMVGSILVARLGRDSIPVEWLEARERLPPLP